MGRLDDKVLLLTGAASGIGRASALRAAREGAALFLTDVVTAGLEDTAKRASELGAKVEFRAADISDEQQARSSVAACIERFGRLDVLCNNAGIIAYERVHEMSLAFWRRILSVNLDGTFLMTREAIPHLLATKGAFETADQALVDFQESCTTIGPDRLRHIRFPTGMPEKTHMDCSVAHRPTLSSIGHRLHSEPSHRQQAEVVR